MHPTGFLSTHILNSHSDQMTNNRCQIWCSGVSWVTCCLRLWSASWKTMVCVYDCVCMYIHTCVVYVHAWYMYIRWYASPHSRCWQVLRDIPGRIWYPRGHLEQWNEVGVSILVPVYQPHPLYTVQENDDWEDCWTHCRVFSKTFKQYKIVVPILCHSSNRLSTAGEWTFL